MSRVKLSGVDVQRTGGIKCGHVCCLETWNECDKESLRSCQNPLTLSNQTHSLSEQSGSEPPPIQPDFNRDKHL